MLGCFSVQKDLMETGNCHSRERLFSGLQETLAWDPCLVKRHEVVVDSSQYHSEFCFQYCEQDSL